MLALVVRRAEEVQLCPMVVRLVMVTLRKIRLLEAQVLLAAVAVAVAVALVALVQIILLVLVVMVVLVTM
jgi:hypothetical protein